MQQLLPALTLTPNSDPDPNPDPHPAPNPGPTQVRCLAMQLMSDGFIHCDPHEGNLLGLQPATFTPTLSLTPTTHPNQATSSACPTVGWPCSTSG